jgi:hypothetical protein
LRETFQKKKGQKKQKRRPVWPCRYWKRPSRTSPSWRCSTSIRTQLGMGLTLSLSLSLSLSVGMLPTRPKLLTGVHHPLGSYDRLTASSLQRNSICLGQGHGENDWDGGPRWGTRSGAGAGRRQADRLPWPALPMKPPARR